VTRSVIYLSDYDRDELEIGRRVERDHERELMHQRRRGEPGRTRRRAIQAARAAEVEIDTSITAVSCPTCKGNVYVPTDSDAERVDCFCCDARLISRRALDGSITLVEESK